MHLHPYFGPKKLCCPPTLSPNSGSRPPPQKKLFWFAWPEGSGRFFRRIANFTLKVQWTWKIKLQLGVFQSVQLSYGSLFPLPSSVRYLSLTWQKMARQNKNSDQTEFNQNSKARHSLRFVKYWRHKFVIAGVTSVEWKAWMLVKSFSKCHVRQNVHDFICRCIYMWNSFQVKFAALKGRPDLPPPPPIGSRFFRLVLSEIW